jgi:predicted DNA-binding protein with PD1-like motif
VLLDRERQGFCFYLYKFYKGDVVMAEFQAAAATGGISSHVHFQRECQTSEEEESRSSDLGGGGGGTGKGISQTQIIQSSSGGGGGGGAEGGSGTVEVARKPRGRPPGSKNKPKPPIIITRDNENAMRPHVLEVAVGCDVGESVLQFVRRRQIGLCIMSGSGTVASVTLRQPTVPGAPLNFRGRFEILSLSGMYLPSPSSSSSSSSSLSGGLTISLAGAQGQVVGGSVAGELTAAGPVTIIAASFTSPSYHRLPAELDEENAANTQLQNNQGSLAASTGHGHPLPNDSCGGMAIYSNPINSQLSPDALAWATGLRTPY